MRQKEFEVSTKSKSLQNSVAAMTQGYRDQAEQKQLKI
jgi:hypothetical protein